MKHKNVILPAVLLLNTAALACLVYFSVLFLSGDTAVPNPDAMLPMQRRDGAGWCLTLGILPMLGANLLLYFAAAKGKSIWLRLACFLPLTAEAALATAYLVMSFSAG